MKKIFCLLILNRLFLNNVKVEPFVYCRKNSLLTTQQKWGDNVLKAFPSVQWAPVKLTSMLSSVSRPKLLARGQNIFDREVHQQVALSP